MIVSCAGWNVSIIVSAVTKDVFDVINSPLKESVFSTLYATILIRINASNAPAIALEIVVALFSLRLVLTK